MKRLRYLLEAIPVYAAYGLLRMLPLDTAACVGAWIGREVGYRLPVNQVARTNLARALPEIGESAREDILHAMWARLGRTVAEFCHLDDPTLRGRIPLRTPEMLVKLKESGRPLLFLSGHLGNWELAPLAAAMHGLPVMLIYRRTNNPYVNHLVVRVRAGHLRGAFGKGRGGIRHLIRSLKEGQPVALMVDQKENGGQPVPFFHAPAMTTPLPVQLARKTGAKLVMVRVCEGEEGRYVIDLLPLEVASGMTDSDNLAILERINGQFEAWIREAPQDWFWVHRRWPKEGS